MKADGRKVASAPDFVEACGMPTRRTVRVAEVLRKELAACMSHSLDLEGLLITISSVELPPDMRQAFIFVSTLNPELDQERALEVLKRNRKEWQSIIGRRLGLKFTPQLIFRFDEALERGDRVMGILTQLEIEKERGGPGSDKAD
jgi:ribosome-binding factor A